MTNEKELVSLVLNEETGLLILKMNNQPDVNVPPKCILSIQQHRASGKGNLTVEVSVVSSAVPVGNSKRETSLLHICAGSSVPHHRHAGDEITVVLQGSFSDQDDNYGVGDFIVRTPGERHRPVASQDEDCLCLTTLDRPIVMTNLLFRLLQPLL